MPGGAARRRRAVPSSASWSGFGVRPRAMMRTPRSTGCWLRNENPRSRSCWSWNRSARSSRPGLAELLGLRGRGRSCRSSGPGRPSGRTGRARRRRRRGRPARAPCAASSRSSAIRARTRSEVDLGQRHDVGADEVDDVVGDEDPERRERGRGLGDARPARCRARVATAQACTGAVPAVGDHREGARRRRRATPAPGGWRWPCWRSRSARCPTPRRRGRARAARRRRGRIAARAASTSRCMRPAGEAGGGQVAEHRVGVGDGRLVAAAAVADRARRRAGALGPDEQARLGGRGRSSRRRRRRSARRPSAGRGSSGTASSSRS